MSTPLTQPAGIQLALYIGQQVRHTDFKGKRVTGVVRSLDADQERGLMASIALDEPIIIPANLEHGLTETRIHWQHVPAHELAPFDSRDELIAELAEAMQQLLDWHLGTAMDDDAEEYSAVRHAHAAIAKATGATA